ncbi:uncharacterized protein LOC115974112 [Quercus lobata]|uniref:uncharacterized protein LOC115974112 n=1 Tax=Quercus lobata TaxID=97700 RepID=UPI0012443C86|nr:uncharacterized protein LOC115974112 [Quercus lobata]
MKLPPKIKIFAWRACANSLPVYVKMADRGIQLCCDCPVCGEDFESLTHALIQCDFALSVWALWNNCPLFLLNALDFTDIVLHFCSSPNGEHLDYFSATAWAIWHNRNQLVHNEKGLSPLQIWDLARSIIQDIHEANNKLSHVKYESNVGWLAPPPRYFKVNVDGASPLDGNGTFSVGAIVCNSDGKVVAALCKALPSIYPAEWTKLFALEQGIFLAQLMAISKVIFESDAALAIQAISQGSCGGEIGHLIQGILEAGQVNRAFNGAAHELAQYAKWNNASHVWKDVFPLFLNSLFHSVLN